METIDRHSPLAHILDILTERQDGHALTRNRNIESSLPSMPLFRRGLANRDLSEMAIVHIDDAIPCDRLGVNVQTREAICFLWGEIIGIGLVDAEFFEAFELEWRELALALL